MSAESVVEKQSLTAELDALKLMYTDALTVADRDDDQLEKVAQDAGGDTADQQSTTLSLKLAQATLRFTVSGSYPDQVPTVEIVDSDTVTDDRRAQLKDAIETHAAQLVGKNMINNLIEKANELLAAVDQQLECSPDVCDTTEPAAEAAEESTEVAQVSLELTEVTEEPDTTAAAEEVAVNESTEKVTDSSSDAPADNERSSSSDEGNASKTSTSSSDAVDSTKNDSETTEKPKPAPQPKDQRRGRNHRKNSGSKSRSVSKNEEKEGSLVIKVDAEDAADDDDANAKKTLDVDTKKSPKNGKNNSNNNNNNSSNNNNSRRRWRRKRAKSDGSSGKSDNEKSADSNQVSGEKNQNENGRRRSNRRNRSRRRRSNRSQSQGRQNQVISNGNGVYYSRYQGPPPPRHYGQRPMYQRGGYGGYQQQQQPAYYGAMQAQNSWQQRKPRSRAGSFSAQQHYDEDRLINGPRDRPGYFAARVFRSGSARSFNGSTSNLATSTTAADVPIEQQYGASEPRRSRSQSRGHQQVNRGQRPRTRSARFSENEGQFDYYSRPRYQHVNNYYGNYGNNNYYKKYNNGYYGNRYGGFQPVQTYYNSYTGFYNNYGYNRYQNNNGYNNYYDNNRYGNNNYRRNNSQRRNNNNNRSRNLNFLNKQQDNNATSVNDTSKDSNEVTSTTRDMNPQSVNSSAYEDKSTRPAEVTSLDNGVSSAGINEIVSAVIEAAN